MKVAYHFTIPRPSRPELDAAVQDALRLGRRFASEITYLYPTRRVWPYLPRFLCGIRQAGELARLDREVDVHHVYANALYPYPFLRRLRKPIAYTIVTTLKNERRPWFLPWLRNVGQFVVANEADRQTLEGWGIDRVSTVPPGIDLAGFSAHPLALGGELVLMVGSAPWDRTQFRSKGFDLLLDAAKEMDNLRLVFLWRGVLGDVIEDRIRAGGLTDRVEVIDRRVDVNQVLARVHASVVLAAKPDIVKTYPHSLLESLAAGKPVVISGCLGMATYVERSGIGEVVSALTPENLLLALRRLMENYEKRAQNVASLDLSVFSPERFVSAHEEMYRRLCHSSAASPREQQA